MGPGQHPAAVSAGDNKKQRFWGARVPSAPSLWVSLETPLYGPSSPNRTPGKAPSAGAALTPRTNRRSLLFISVINQNLELKINLVVNLSVNR